MTLNVLFQPVNGHLGWSPWGASISENVLGASAKCHNKGMASNEKATSKATKYAKDDVCDEFLGVHGIPTPSVLSRAKKNTRYHDVY